MAGMAAEDSTLPPSPRAGVRAYGEALRIEDVERPLADVRLGSRVVAHQDLQLMLAIGEGRGIEVDDPTRCGAFREAREERRHAGARQTQGGLADGFAVDDQEDLMDAFPVERPAGDLHDSVVDLAGRGQEDVAERRLVE